VVLSPESSIMYSSFPLCLGTIASLRLGPLKRSFEISPFFFLSTDARTLVFSPFLAPMADRPFGALHVTGIQHDLFGGWCEELLVAALLPLCWSEGSVILPFSVCLRSTLLRPAMVFPSRRFVMDFRFSTLYPSLWGRFPSHDGYRLILPLASVISRVGSSTFQGYTFLVRSLRPMAVGCGSRPYTSRLNFLARADQFFRTHSPWLLFLTSDGPPRDTSISTQPLLHSKKAAQWLPFFAPCLMVT